MLSFNSRRIVLTVLSPLPSHLDNNKSIENKAVCLLAFFNTLCLAFEDSSRLESCLKQCVFPALFSHGIARACEFSFRGQRGGKTPGVCASVGGC